MCARAVQMCEVFQPAKRDEVCVVMRGCLLSAYAHEAASHPCCIVPGPGKIVLCHWHGLQVSFQFTCTSTNHSDGCSIHASSVSESNQFDLHPNAIVSWRHPSLLPCLRTLTFTSEQLARSSYNHWLHLFYLSYKPPNCEEYLAKLVSELQRHTIT